MKWYIGQPIVAIRNHDKGRFSKGQEFVVDGIKRSFCNCKGVLLDIGFAATTQKIKCYKCECVFQVNDGINWMHERNFAPLDQDISELTEILEQPLTKTLETK